MTAASTPSAPAMDQLTAVMTRVSMPISSAVNSLLAVARTPRPHLLYFRRTKRMPRITTVMARQMSACFVMLMVPPRALMLTLGEVLALTKL